MSRGSVIILLMLFVMAAAGCATKAPPGVVLIGEKKVSGLVEVSPIESTRTETGTIRVWTQLKNKTRKKIDVDARAIFLGSNGAVVEASSGWTKLFIESNATATFQTTSMSTEAKSYTIEVRKGQ